MSFWSGSGREVGVGIGVREGRDKELWDKRIRVERSEKREVKWLKVTSINVLYPSKLFSGEFCPILIDMSPLSTYTYVILTVEPICQVPAFVIEITACLISASRTSPRAF